MRALKRKTAIFAAITILSFFGMAIGSAFPSTALAWDDCPKGLVNDPYPGACRRYVDTNGDNICDLSQSEPVATTTTTTAVATTSTSTTSTTKVAATTSNLATTTTTSGEPPTGDCPLGPCLGCGACFGVPVAAATASVDPAGDTADAATAAGTAALVAATGSANTTTTTPFSGRSDDSAPASQATVAATTDDSGGPSLMTHYMVSPIAIAFFFIYGASFVLYKTKRMRIATHRKIWNVLLMATFLITGIFGLILTIQLDYELPFTIPFNLLFWHVEAGIVMTLISLFHMGWHFNYYRNLVRNSRSKVRAARAAERAGSVGGRELVMEARQQRSVERQQLRVEQEFGRADQGARRGAAAGWDVAAQRAAAQPERAARTPRPRTDLDS